MRVATRASAAVRSRVSLVSAFGSGWRRSVSRRCPNRAASWSVTPSSRARRFGSDESDTPATIGNAANRLPLWSSAQVGDEAIRDRLRLAERDQVTARDLVDVSPQPFPRHAPLEVDREEPVVATGEDLDRDVRPPLERAGLAERGARRAPPGGHAVPDRRRDVVQEVPLFFEARAVPQGRVGRLPRLDRTGVGPPIP